MGINSQSQALMDKIRAKKGIPLFFEYRGPCTGS